MINDSIFLPIFIFKYMDEFEKFIFHFNLKLFIHHFFPVRASKKKHRTDYESVRVFIYLKFQEF